MLSRVWAVDSKYNISDHIRESRSTLLVCSCAQEDIKLLSFKINALLNVPHNLGVIAEAHGAQ